MASTALDALDLEMAAHLRARLTKIDETIYILQEMRKEADELFAELFSEMV